MVLVVEAVTGITRRRYLAWNLQLADARMWLSGVPGLCYALSGNARVVARYPCLIVYKGDCGAYQYRCSYLEHSRRVGSRTRCDGTKGDRRCANVSHDQDKGKSGGVVQRLPTCLCIHGCASKQTTTGMSGEIRHGCEYIPLRSRIGTFQGDRKCIKMGG